MKRAETTPFVAYKISFPVEPLVSSFTSPSLLLPPPPCLPSSSSSFDFSHASLMVPSEIKSQHLLSFLFSSNLQDVS